MEQDQLFQGMKAATQPTQGQQATAPSMGQQIISSAPKLIPPLLAGTSMAPVAGAIAAPVVGYNTLTGINDLAHGNNLNTAQQVSLALPTFGASFLANPIMDAFGLGESKTQVEQNKWDSLKNQGIKVPDNAGQKAPNGGFDPSVAPDFVGTNPANNQWVNNPFAQSRSEGDLKPEDIVGYADWVGKFGPQWMTLPLDQKIAIANYALQNGLVREHHGTVDINFTPDLLQFSQQTTIGASQQQAAAAAAAAQAQQNAQFAGIEKTQRDQMAAAQKQQVDAANKQMANQNLLAMMNDANNQRQQAMTPQTSYADYFKPVIDNMKGQQNGQSTANNQ